MVEGGFCGSLLEGLANLATRTAIPCLVEIPLYVSLMACCVVGIIELIGGSVLCPEVKAEDS